MNTLGMFTTDEVFDMMKSSKTFNFGEFKNIRLNSTKLMVFKESITCVKCGTKGVIFLLQMDETLGFPVLNLYALKNSSKSVIMTADHIIAKVNGGPRELFNLQTMCLDCNKMKGSKFEPISSKKKAKALYYQFAWQFACINSWKDLMKGPYGNNHHVPA